MIHAPPYGLPMAVSRAHFLTDTLLVGRGSTLWVLLMEWIERGWMIAVSHERRSLRAGNALAPQARSKPDSVPRAPARVRAGRLGSGHDHLGLGRHRLRPRRPGFLGIAMLACAGSWSSAARGHVREGLLGQIALLTAIGSAVT